MSKIEVNAVEPQCGTTLTLGASGDTVTLGSGASQSGFGRTGTVDWQTTPKTANFTAVNGEGYFVNTTSGAITMTMPSGSAGAIVSIQDYNKTFDTNALTVSPASGEKINGGDADGDLIIVTEGQGLTFIYVDSTVGWKTVHENEYTLGGSNFIQASGGTITTSGDYKIHTFTGPGTFTVCGAGNSCGSNTVEYLVVAGGGAGGGDLGGGGGAGGYRTVFPSPATGGLPVSVTSYPITVGAGGSAPVGPQPGSPITASTPGSNSVFSGSSTITSAGGGGGGQSQQPFGGTAGSNGGSGGGSSGYGPSSLAGGNGNSPPVSPPQGNNGGGAGGCGPGYPGGGGGGAAAVGGTAPNSSSDGQDGGAGSQNNIDGNNYYWAGGGGGASYHPPSRAGNGGIGGGGGGGKPGSPTSPTTAGTGGGSAINSGGNGNFSNPGAGGVSGGAGGANSGGGGGAGGHNSTPGIQCGSQGGNGGSGIVIIRYKFQ